MLKRERIQECASGELPFLDDKWDDALLGYAENGHDGRMLPCYGYQAAKSLLKNLKLSPVQIYKRLGHLMMEKALMLTKHSKRDLWVKIEDAQYPRWELMDGAVLGIGHVGHTCSSLVYSKPAMIRILLENQKASDGSPEFEEMLAETYIRDHIVSVDLGKRTPWLLTPITQK